ncbi:MAG: GpE family phage tail protein [Oceanospirillaceae bacterium]|nr:GpE family phage tail protein [Oceanospirillaceae bacterium]
MEEAYADIASVFHWSMSDLDAIPYVELIEWRQRALDRIVRPVGFPKKEKENGNE